MIHVGKVKICVFMTIDPITSLADLEFKAKTNKYYKQLAIIGCNQYMFGNKKVRTYPAAIKALHIISINHNPNSCDAVVYGVNSYRDKIREIKEPTSEELLKKQKNKELRDKRKQIKLKKFFREPMDQL